MSDRNEKLDLEGLDHIKKALARALSRASSPRATPIPRRIVAVELSTHSMKIAHLEGGRRLRRASYFAVPEEHLEDRVVRNRLLGDCLRRELRAARTRKFICVLPSSRTRTSIVDLPPLSEDDTVGALALKALKLLSGDPAEWLLSAFPLAGTHTEKEGTRRYQIVAVEAAEARDIEQVFHHARQLPIAITSSSSAYQRLMENTGAIETEKDAPVEQQVWVVVEMNRYSTTVHIYCDGVLAFSRIVQFGGENLTRALMDVVATEEGFIELTLPEAEALKRAVGIPEAGDSSPIEGSPLNAEQVRMMLEPKLNSLVFEVRNSIRFFQQQSGNRSIGRLLLTGGSSRLGGLDQFLFQQVKIRPQHWGPADSRLSLEGLAESEVEFLFADAASLVAVMQSESIREDLTPPEMALERRLRGPFRIVTTVCVIALAIIIGFGFSVRSSNAESRELSGPATAPVEFVRTVESLHAEVQEFERKHNSLVQLQGYRTQAAQFLADVARRLPDAVVLKEITIADTGRLARVQIVGRLRLDPGETRAPRRIIDDAFGDSPFVKETNIKGISEGGAPDVYAFDLDCTLYLTGWEEEP